MQPGVLVGLNSLLEQDGSITLPTGEVISGIRTRPSLSQRTSPTRDAAASNQSVLDRMNLTQDGASPEIMAQRAMSVTGCEDDYGQPDGARGERHVRLLSEKQHLRRQHAVCAFIDWIMSTEVTGRPL